MPVIINFSGEVNIPYINIDDVLENETNAPEILITPFTKIKDIKQIQEIELEDAKKIPIYNVVLEKQDLQELTFEEKEALYNYILTSADVANQKINECVEYEKEFLENYNTYNYKEFILGEVKEDNIACLNMLKKLNSIQVSPNYYLLQPERIDEFNNFIAKENIDLTLPNMSARDVVEMFRMLKEDKPKVKVKKR